MARLGASAAAHDVARPAAEAHGAALARPAVAAPSLAPVPAARAWAPPEAGANAVTPPPMAPVPRAAAPALDPPGARAVAAPPAATARRGRPLAAVRAHGGVPGGARVLRRERTPWHLLGRGRLATAWGAVQRDHGGGPAELRLLGVFGPLPLGAVTDAALEPDGRLRVALGGRRPGRTGDVALARDLATGRLVRADAPYPGIGGGGRRLR